MLIGGAIAAAGLILTALHFPWYVQVAIYVGFGFGFYLLHGSIQVHVTDLSQTARGAATSLHSCFFFSGRRSARSSTAIGFAHGGPEWLMFLGSAVVMGVASSARGCCATATGNALHAAAT